MDLRVVPQSSQNLSLVEEMLIAHICPIMCIYRKHGGQHGYKGHVINFPQDIKEFLRKLPCNVSDLTILIVHRRGADNTHKDFRVRRARVLGALYWLKQNNPCYKDITIDMDALANLPLDGVPEEILSIDDVTMMITVRKTTIYRVQKMTMPIHPAHFYHFLWLIPPKTKLLTQLSMVVITLNGQT